MSQCITSKNGNTNIPQATTAIKAATIMAPTGNTKRGQSVDDLALTASRPTWRDSLKAKKQKLKQRSLTFDHFYRYVCRCWNRYSLRFGWKKKIAYPSRSHMNSILHSIDP